MIDHRKITSTMSVDDVLEIAFPSATVYRSIARMMIEAFEKSGSKTITSHEMSTLISESGYPRGTCYKVLGLLDKMGMIEFSRFYRAYNLSTEFYLALRKLGMSWEKFVNEIERSE